VIRTLCLGFDGATPQLLFPWIEAGELPHLAALQRRSRWGRLASTVPPMTLPAWSSFLTGVSPAEHGIFDFTRREFGTGRVRVVDARDRAVPTLPRLLSDRGHHVGTFFFPTTWPPEQLSGGQISGFDSPVATRVPPEACHPRELYDLSLDSVGHPLSFAAVSELSKGDRWEQQATVALLRGIEEKEKFALTLIRERPPYDFLGLLFGESDTAAHHFWHLADPSSPRHDPSLAVQYGDVLLQVYRRLDTCLGRLLDADPGFESVVIASDHGFGGSSDRVLHLNSYLEEQGFLRWKGSSWSASLPRRIAQRVPERFLERAVRSLPEKVVAGLDGYSRYGAIDFRHTTVFSDERDYAPSLWFNLEGRDPMGIVSSEERNSLTRGALREELERCLLAWRDPVDGAPIVRRLRSREEVFVGPCADRAPDFLLELERPSGYSYNVLPSRPGGPSTARVPRASWSGAKGAGMAGSHREDGIYLLALPELEPGEERLDIAGLLPRWLEAQGLRLDSEPSVGTELHGSAIGAAAGEPTRGTSLPEASALADRLRKLGYLQ
jgi:predicted AlkP superfamily phosphohydrolase/phosphomutase